MPKVLVIDDDVVIRELVEYKLGREGLQVHTAADGEAGLDAARQLAPDVILLDWMMPRLSGLEVCAAVRADEATIRPHVILLTAKAQEADVERGFEAGADDYMVKPFSPRELASRVNAALAQRSPAA